MKTKLFFIFLTLFLVSTLYLPNTFAQDYTTWNLPEGAKARLGKGTIEDIQFSPDNKLLAVAGSIGIWIYDVDTDEEGGIQSTGHTFQGIHAFEESAFLTQHTGIVTSIAFSPDGSLLASGSLDNTIRLWDVSNFTLNQTITGHTGGVSDVAFSPDGLTLASASADKTIRIWSPVSGEEEMRFTGHTDAVTSVAFSPDGKTLASGSADTTIRLWDTRTGKHQQTLTGHTDRVTSVAFNPDVSLDSDGKTLASGSWDKTIRLWDITTGDLKHTLTDNGTPTDGGLVIPMREVNSVSFRSDGYVLASGSRDGRIRLWATLTGELKQSVDPDWQLLDTPHSVLCFSSDGFVLASGYKDGTLISLQVSPTLKYVIGRERSFNYQDDRYTRYNSRAKGEASFSPDGAMYARVAPPPEDHRSTIRLWDISTGTLKQTFMTEDSGDIWAISFLPDGKTLASVGQEQVFNEEIRYPRNLAFPTLRWWDISTGRLKRQVRLVDQIGPEKARYLGDGTLSPDGLALVVQDDRYGGRQHRIYLFDAFTVGLKQTFIIGDEDDSWTTNIAFSPDSKTVAAGQRTGTIRLWSVETGQLKQVIHAGIHPSSLEFSPDGRILVSVGGTTRLWNADTGKHLDTITSLSGGLTSGVFTPDGKMLSYLDSRTTSGSVRSRFIPYRWQNSSSASPSAALPAGAVALWQLSDGKLEQLDIDTDFSTVRGHLSPDGVTLVASQDVRAVASLGLRANGPDYIYYPLHYVTDLSTVDPYLGKQTISGHTSGVGGLSFSPDGSTLASAHFRDICLWDVETITLKDTLDYANVSGVLFTPDGETLVSGSSNAVKSWSVSAGEQRQTLTVGDMNWVFSVSFSPNGSTLASGGTDKTVRLWNMETDTLQHTLTGHTDAVTSVAFSRFHGNGFTLASASADKTIRLWNGVTGAHQHTLTRHTDRVSSVAFSPEEGILTLASGSYDGTIRLWDGITGAHKNTLTGHNRFVLSVAFDPDGKTLASGGVDNTIRLWDPNTGKLKRILIGHTNGVTSVTFSPDGGTLASGSNDGTVLLWDLTLKTPQPTDLTADINGDGVVNIQDLVLVSSNLGKTGENPADINDDGVVNIQDLVLVAAELGNAAAAPSIRHDDFASAFTRTEVEQWLTQAQQLNLTDATSQRGIRFLEQLLLALTPKETSLLANYPNPFNPETWIPYQLAEPADVTLHIHAIDGSLVRTLSLGHKAVGIYQTRSRAAYWDGKNEVGEPVASGVYFYTLTANDFNATRKMLIRK